MVSGTMDSIRLIIRYLRQGRLTTTLLAFCLGCSDYRTDVERFTPSTDTARSALVTVLDARKDRRPNQPNAETLKGIIVVDTHDHPRAELLEYRIVGERPNDSGRMFVVELQWSDVAEKERANFIVLGIDPLLVFHEEDLAMITHWDDAMAHPDSATQPNTTSK